MNKATDLTNPSNKHSVQTTGPPSSFYTATADTGASDTFLTVDLPMHNKWIAINPITMQNLNGMTMKSNHEGDLPVTTLPPDAHTSHIVPNLKTKSSASIGKPCNAGCDVNFTPTAIMVLHKGKMAMTGTCTPPGL